MRSLRARVTLAAVGSVAIAVLMAGTAFVSFVAGDHRREAEATANVRVVAHGAVRFQRGDQAVPWPPPSGAVPKIIEAGGNRWLVRTTPLGPDAFYQVAVDTRKTAAALVVHRAAQFGLLALALAGGLGWVTATLALQALARGDAGALARTEPLDLADAAVQAAQARHPSVHFSFVDPGGPVPRPGCTGGGAGTGFRPLCSRGRRARAGIGARPRARRPAGPPPQRHRADRALSPRWCAGHGDLAGRLVSRGGPSPVQPFS